MSPWTKQVVVHEGAIACKGWAYSGGGRWPERVELSADGGFSWYAVPTENLSRKHKFAWRTWHCKSRTLHISPFTPFLTNSPDGLPCAVEGWIELVVRCWDNSLNTQPLEVRSAWNWGLHVTSSAHRIRIYSVNKSKPETARRLEEFKKRGQGLTPITRPTEFPYMSWEGV